MENEVVKCDLTGSVVKEGVKELDVDVSEGLRLRVTPLVRIGDKRYGQGILSEAGAEKIRKALAGVKATRKPAQTAGGKDKTK